MKTSLKQLIDAVLKQGKISRQASSPPVQSLGLVRQADHDWIGFIPILLFKSWGRTLEWKVHVLNVRLMQPETHFLFLFWILMQ